MAKEYEIKFKLAGELDSSFKRSISGASDDFNRVLGTAKQLGKPIKSTLTQPVRDDLKRTQTEMRNTESVASKMRNVLSKSLLPLAAGAGAGALLSNSLNKSMDFESQLDSIQAVGGIAEREMKKVHDLALKLGADTKYSALEAAQGMEELIKAGMSVSQVMDGGLDASLNLAAAGSLELAEAAEIMSTAMNAFKDDALTAAEASDILAGTANASATSVQEMRYSLAAVSSVASGVGLAFKDTNIALGLFANNGLKGSDAGTSLKTMLLNLIPSTKAQYEEFERLGLMTYNAQTAMDFLSKNGVKVATNAFEDVDLALRKYTAVQAGAKVGSDKANAQYMKVAMQTGAMTSAFYDANGSIQSLEDISGTLQKSLKGMSDAQRTVALETMFGTDAIRAANIIYKEGADGVKNFNAEMSKVTALDVAKQKMDNAKGAIEQFKGAMETLQISVLEPTLPLIKDLALAAADASEQFQEWMKTREAKEFGETLLSFLQAVPKLIAATATALAAVKLGGVISNTVQFVKGLSAVGTAGSGAAGALGLLSKSAMFLTSPVGMAVGAVGLLTTGVIAYKRHNEQVRQSLINMGADLKLAYDDYSGVQTQTAETQKLTSEYDRLKQKISDSKTPADELTEAKRKLVEVESTLKDMYPEIIDQHDIENGKLAEKIGLIDRLSAAQLEEAKLKLEQTVLEKSGKQDDLAGEIANLRGDKDKAISDKDKYSAARVTFTELETELNQLFNSNIDQHSDEWSNKINDIVKRANVAGAEVGRSFSHVGLIDGVAEELRKEALDAFDDINKSSKELATAEGSYQELYDAKLKLLEINLGGDIETEAAKFKEMSKTQQDAFLKTIEEVKKLNQEMMQLPTEKRINVSMLYEDMGMPQLKTFKTHSMKPGLVPYADGGFVNRPHMGLVGEAGPEAIIPLSANRRGRAMSLYESVGKALGVRPYANGGIVGNYSKQAKTFIDDNNDFIGYGAGYSEGIHSSFAQVERQRNRRYNRSMASAGDFQDAYARREEGHRLRKQLSKTKNFSKAAKMFGKVVRPVAYAMDAWDIGFAEKGQRGRTIAKVAGGIGGGMAGGAAAGAMLGTFLLPGIGTAVGGALGGLLGAMGGEKLATGLFDWFGGRKKKYADGGFINRPHMGLVGEAGPEAIIPLSTNRRSRAMSLYESVGKTLGVKPFADGGVVNASRIKVPKEYENSSNRSLGAASSVPHVSITFEGANINIQGNTDASTVELLKQALDQYKRELEPMVERTIEQLYKQKVRVSMSGV